MGWLIWGNFLVLRMNVFLENLCVIFYVRVLVFWAFHISCSDYTLITNLMHWLLFIHKIRFFLYMFRASSAHLQDDTVVHMQHMVLSLSTTVRGDLSVHSLSNSKHVGEYNILWINNNQCIKLVINIQGVPGGMCNTSGECSLC